MREKTGHSVTSECPNIISVVKKFFDAQQLVSKKTSFVYYRGLKLKLVGGPNSRDKMLRGPQFTRKKYSRKALKIS